MKTHLGKFEQTIFIFSIFAFVVGLLWCLTYDEEEDNEDVKDNSQEKKEVLKDSTINEMMKECIDELEESLR